MKLKTLKGTLKDFPVKPLINWEGNSLSVFQEKVKAFLYLYWKNDVVCEEFRIVERMSLDLFNVSKHVAVEIQGRQHNEYVKHFARSRSGYEAQLHRDRKKADWCSINQIVLVEILPEDLPLTKEWFLKTYQITL